MFLHKDIEMVNLHSDPHQKCLIKAVLMRGVGGGGYNVCFLWMSMLLCINDRNTPVL